MKSNIRAVLTDSVLPDAMKMSFVMSVARWYYVNGRKNAEGTRYGAYEKRD